MYFLIVLFLLTTSDTYTDGQELIQAMHAKYHKTWYSHFTFTQKTTFYKENKPIAEQTWYEALSSPGKLHIKFNSPSSANGMLFNDGYQYRYQNATIVSTEKKPHALLLSAFDVYVQPVKKSVQDFITLGFDLTRVTETNENGRPTLILGAKKGDTVSNQIWVDKEFLYVTRVITNDQKKNIVVDARFNKYQRLSGGWVAPEVLIYVNGNLYMKEEYSDMVTPRYLDPSIYDKKNISEAKW